MLTPRFNKSAYLDRYINSTAQGLDKQWQNTEYNNNVQQADFVKTVCNTYEISRRRRMRLYWFRQKGY